MVFVGEEGKEGETEITKPIERLNVLVHPLWSYQTRLLRERSIARYDRERRQMATAMAKRMVPRTVGEVTIFMPHVKPGDVKSLRENLMRARSEPKYMQWPELYREMQRTLGDLRNNLILGPNLVERIDLWQPISMDEFDIFLRGKGFRITEETEVVVGGELLSACVYDAVVNLMGHAKICRLKLDRKAILTSGYIFDSHPSSEEADWRSFVERLGILGLTAEDEGEYVVIKRGGTNGSKA